MSNFQASEVINFLPELSAELSQPDNPDISVIYNVTSLLHINVITQLCWGGEKGSLWGKVCVIFSQLGVLMLLFHCPPSYNYIVSGLFVCIKLPVIPTSDIMRCANMGIVLLLKHWHQAVGLILVLRSWHSDNLLSPGMNQHMGKTINLFNLSASGCFF